MLEWFRDHTAHCERWAQNGFPITAQLCTNPAWEWSGISMLAMVIVGACFLLLALWPNAPEPLALLLAILFMLALLGIFISMAWVVLAGADLWTPELLTMMSRPWFVLPVLLFAAILYGLRCQRRFAYGCIEILVGIVTLLAVISSAGSAGSGRDVGASLLAKGLGLVSGTYIIVRGLDNLDSSLPPSWRALWNEVFRKPLI